MSDSKSNQDVFSGDNYAENYRKGRPLHPKSLGDAILKFLRMKVRKIEVISVVRVFVLMLEQFLGDLDLAVDVGCGPGESVEILQPHFDKILGLDNSQSMIDNANKNNSYSNVEYLWVSFSSFDRESNNSLTYFQGFFR